MKRFKSAQDIKVGIVGFGGMARWHVEGLAEAGLALIEVADIDPAALKAAQQEVPGVTAYPSATAMLKKGRADVVIVITPHNTHACLVLECLNAGRHVVCEKPLAITTAECDRMIRAAKKNKVFLSAFHNRHWDGLILNAMKKIRAGVIGDIVRVEAHMAEYSKPGTTWRSSKSLSGGVLYDWGVHLIEYMLQVVDSDIVEVTGFARNGFWAAKTPWKKDTNEDEGLAIVRFSSGAWGSLTVSQIDSNPKRGVLEITGTKGTLICGHEDWESIAVKGKQTIIKKGKNTPDEWHRYYANVVDFLTGKGTLAITPEWARRPIHILDLANQSAKQGKSLNAKHK